MLTRAMIVIVASTLLAACVDSDRLRSNLGGPAGAAQPEQDAGKRTAEGK